MVLMFKCIRNIDSWNPTYSVLYTIKCNLTIRKRSEQRLEGANIAQKCLKSEKGLKFLNDYSILT